MQNFFKHLRDNSPGFRCCKPGAGESKLEHEVKVCHNLGDPASQKKITALLTKLGEGSEQFETLYSQYNGMVLYVSGDDAGIVFYPVEDIEECNSDWREWFEDMEEEDLWDFQKNGIAFGEIVASGNYFVYWKGKIYYSDHDGGDDDPYGNTLSEFLDRIAENTAKFLYNAGCYTRYGSEQWIPMEYAPNLC